MGRRRSILCLQLSLVHDTFYATRTLLSAQRLREARSASDRMSVLVSGDIDIDDASTSGGTRFADGSGSTSNTAGGLGSVDLFLIVLGSCVGLILLVSVLHALGSCSYRRCQAVA